MKKSKLKEIIKSSLKEIQEPLFEREPCNDCPGGDSDECNTAYGSHSGCVWECRNKCCVCGRGNNPDPDDNPMVRPPSYGGTPPYPMGGSDAIRRESKSSNIKKIVKEELRKIMLTEQPHGSFTEVQCIQFCADMLHSITITINQIFQGCVNINPYDQQWVQNCTNMRDQGIQDETANYQSCVAECRAYDWHPDDSDPNHPGGGGGTAGGRSCFIAGTKVKMADGTNKNIEDVVIGDEVQGENKINTVIGLDWVQLANRKLYSFNEDGNYFTTSDHPFKTTEGWKSINPSHTKERDGVELFEQLTGELSIGNTLLILNGEKELKSIDSKEIDNPELQLYNFNLDGDHSYYANEYLVHNKQVLDPAGFPLDPEDPTGGNPDDPFVRPNRPTGMPYTRRI